MDNFITEDGIVNCIKKNNGILITRKHMNINDKDLSQCEEYTYIGLTGYQNIVDYFFNTIIHKFKYKIILVTIETDGFQIKPHYLEHPLLHHWFTWNKPIDHPKLTCIPIGLNQDRQLYSLLEYMDYNINTNYWNIKKEKLFAVNLSIATNPKRVELADLAKNKWSTFCSFIENIPYKKVYNKPSNIEGIIGISETDPKCYEILSQYKFILSPPGAGLDCHRTWEALYMGTIPIVITSSIDELFEDLPVVIVDSWEQITEDYLNTQYDIIREKIDNNEYNLNKLTGKYWMEKINNIKKNIEIDI